MECTETMAYARLSLKSLKVKENYNKDCVKWFLENCKELNVPDKNLHKYYKKTESDIWLVRTDAYKHKNEYGGKYFYNHHIVYEKIISNELLLNICVMTNYFIKDNYEPVVLLSIKCEENPYRNKNWRYLRIKDKIPKIDDIILDVQIDDTIDKILLSAQKELKKLGIKINKYK